MRGWLTALDANDRQGRLDGLQHRPRQGRADRRRLQAVLRQRQGQGPRRHDLAAGRLEDRRRHGVGLDLLRSRAQPDLSTAPAIPGPWNPDQRPGDNKWTAGIFARDPDTGEARWFYQFSPHDLLRLRRHQREDPARPDVERAAAQGARPPRAQRLHLRHRPHDRRGALGRAVRHDQRDHGRRPQDRPPDTSTGQEAAA